MSTQKQPIANQDVKCSDQKSCKNRENDKYTQCSAMCMSHEVQCCNRAVINMNFSKFETIRSMLGIIQSTISKINNFDQTYMNGTIGDKLLSPLDVANELLNFFARGQCCSLCHIHYELIKGKILSLLINTFSTMVAESTMNGLFGEEIVQIQQDINEYVISS